MNWSHLHQNFCVRFHDKITSTTSKLQTFFNIDFFGYHKIDDNGHYISLMNHPDWGEYYIEKEFYNNDPFLNLPNHYEEGITFFTNNVDINFSKGLKKNSIDQGIVIIKKIENAAEFFVFGKKSNSQDFSKLYLNHSKLLLSYSYYFKKELKSILSNQLLEGYNIIEYSHKKSLEQSKILQKDKISFLSSIGFQNICIEIESLSNREKECLKELYKGQSTKKIAARLNISPRTVESYFMNIKNKLSCWNKDDLISKAAIFDQIDLL